MSWQLLPPGCPLAVHEVVDLDIDRFNHLMATYKFTEEQVEYFRDRRRRGKNRVNIIMKCWPFCNMQDLPVRALSH